MGGGKKGEKGKEISQLLKNRVFFYFDVLKFIQLAKCLSPFPLFSPPPKKEYIDIINKYSSYYIRMASLRELQHLDYSEENIKNIVSFVTKSILPPHIKTEKQKKRFEKLYKDFVINKQGILTYEPKNLVVVPPNAVEKTLEQFYGESEALGKGQNNWYRLITQHVLGITKRQAIEFLKSKEVYQLTRDPNKAVNKPLLASRPYQIYAIDLVDVARYKQGNNRYIFILTIVDLFSGYTWFEPLRNKESKDVLEAFKRMIQESGDHLPSAVISDNGKEFLGSLDAFFKEKKIKHMFTKSYTPQPNVEAANKQLRKIMRELFVKTGKLVWYKSLKDIQNAKNTQWNENHKDMPGNILQKYDVDNKEDKKRIAEMAKTQRERNKLKLKAYKEDTLNVGDYVRIRLATQQSQLREKIKAGKKKLIVVHFSPDVYRVKQVFPPHQNRLGQYKYTLENAEGKIVERQGKDYAERFKRIDLLKVGANQKMILSQSDANTLNKLNDPEDIQVESNEPIPVVAKPIPAAKEKKIKKIDDFNSRDWENFLKDKEFTDSDDDIRYRITSVSNKNKTYICRVVESNNPKIWRLFTLYDVLVEGKKESWYIKDFDIWIERLK